MSQKFYSLQAIGQDSHRFVLENDQKPLILGGYQVEYCSGLAGNSDADVLLHALINAISGITCKAILGGIADELCLKHGITDSKAYLEIALADLTEAGYELAHISFTVQAQKPKFFPIIDLIRESISEIVRLDQEHIMLTATSGENLTEVAKGEGIEAFCLITVIPLEDKNR